MAKTNTKLTLAITSSTLFDLTESDTIFKTQGIQAYSAYQIANENKNLAEGVAFSLIKKLLNLKHPETQENLVEVILLSRNSADTGLRIFNNIHKIYALPITRAAFTNGQSPYRYIKPFNADLFLSTNPEDVARALSDDCAAATILLGHSAVATDSELRIAFDGDAVLFSDEAEKIYQTEGFDGFQKNESDLAQKPLSAGPFTRFLKALNQLQALFPVDNSPIRTALVTARSAPAHERVIRTLRSWHIRIDEALFLGGLNKCEFLRAFGADVFFDDSPQNCLDSRDHVATGHVPHGVNNLS